MLGIVQTQTADCVILPFMASQRRPAIPTEPSTPGPERQPGLQDWLRIIAEDMDAMGELAVTVHQYKARAAAAPQSHIRSRAETES